MVSPCNDFLTSIHYYIVGKGNFKIYFFNRFFCFCPDCPEQEKRSLYEQLQAIKDAKEQEFEDEHRLSLYSFFIYNSFRAL